MSLFEQFSEFGNAIQQCVLPLVVKIDDKIQPVGTGFIVNASGLFVTAAHVLEAAANFAVRHRRDDGTYYNHYEFYALYASNKAIPDSDNTLGGLLPIDYVWAPQELDIGFGWLRLPRNVQNNSLLPLNPIRIRVAVPKVGDKITAIGYYKMDGAIREGSVADIEYSQKTAISRGVVREVHPEYRDKGMLSFPCFRTDARFDHGMSGGPVFDESGSVIGVVCSSSDASESSSFTSYGSLIWPIFGCNIDIAQGVGSPQQKTLLYDLATQGHIQTDDTFDRVHVEIANSGERTVRIFVPNDAEAT